MGPMEGTGTCESEEPQAKGSGTLEKGDRLSGVLIWVLACPVSLGSPPGRPHFTSPRTLCRADASIRITLDIIYAKSRAWCVSADRRPGMVKIFHLHVLG